MQASSAPAPRTLEPAVTQMADAASCAFQRICLYVCSANTQLLLVLARAGADLLVLQRAGAAGPAAVTRPVAAYASRCKHEAASCLPRGNASSLVSVSARRLLAQPFSEAQQLGLCT